MKYLCLIYQQEKVMDAMPGNDWDAFIVDCNASAAALQDNGHFLAGSALQPVFCATTLRVREGRVIATDGPFAETKEQLAGFCLIEARDLNEAIQLASGMPPARFGCIEVRPVANLREPLTA